MCDFIEIIKNNDLIKLQELPKDSIDHSSIFAIEDFPNSSISSISSSDLSLLHIAAFYGSTECFLYLHYECDFPLHLETPEKYTPIYYACLACSTEIFQFIVYNSSKEELESEFEKEYSNIRRTSLLHFSLTNPFNYILTLENNGYSYDKLIGNNQRKANALFKLAMLHNNILAVKWLLNKYDKKQSKQNTPLMLAIIHRKSDVAQFLIRNNFGSVDYFNNDGESALSLACYMCMEDVVQSICDVITDVDLPSNRSGDCAVHWICKSKSPKIAKIILQKNIDTNRLNGDGKIGPYYLPDATPEKESLEIIKLLLEHGYNINLQEKDKKTILSHFVGAIKFDFNVIEFLISKGASLNDIYQKGITIKERMIEISKKKPKMKEILTRWKITN